VLASAALQGCLITSIKNNVTIKANTNNTVTVCITSSNSFSTKATVYPATDVSIGVPSAGSDTNSWW
jgi:S-adenosylhomocysteine hydrolase